MMVGVLVLPEVMLGITEASTTRKPGMPKTLQAFIHNRQRIAGKAHFRGTDGMEDGGADIARGLGKIGGVVRHCGAGDVFVRPIFRQRGLAHQPPCHPYGVGGDAAIFLGGKIIGLDHRACVRKSADRICNCAT